MRIETVANRGITAYWDTSAIVSALFVDDHTTEATRWLAQAGPHIMSTLAHAETVAFMARIQREGLLPTDVVASARDALDLGPWQPLPLQPDRAMVEAMASRWALRGADLWHLATALTLRRELPTLGFATFDTRLTEAAEGCGMSTAID